MTEIEMVHKLEKKFDFLENIYFVKEENGKHLFSCVDAGADSYLTVDKDGWVVSRPKNKKFGDVLGTI